MLSALCVQSLDEYLDHVREAFVQGQIHGKLASPFQGGKAVAQASERPDRVQRLGFFKSVVGEHLPVHLAQELVDPRTIGPMIPRRLLEEPRVDDGRISISWVLGVPWQCERLVTSDARRHRLPLTYMFTVSTLNPSTPLSSQKRIALS